MNNPWSPENKLKIILNIIDANITYEEKEKIIVHLITKDDYLLELNKKDWFEPYMEKSS